MADSILVIISGTGVAEDVLNYARLTPLVGVGIALGAWVARDESRSRSPGKVQAHAT